MCITSKGNKRWQSWTLPWGNRNEKQFKETVGFAKLMGRKKNNEQKYIYCNPDSSGGDHDWCDGNTSPKLNGERTAKV